MCRCKESGVALLMVIFIIVGVVLIAGPLAYSMIAHETESLSLVDSSRSMTGAYGAMNHSIMKLYDACADKDSSRRSDKASEFSVPDLSPLSMSTITTYMKVLDEDIMKEHASWGATVIDQQSLINLNSITPRICINLLGDINTNLVSYRVKGEEGTYRLFRTVYEARKLGVSDADAATLERLTTVWSGPNTYGYYFSAPIPATVDDSGVIHVYSPDVANRIASGLVIRMLSGDAPDYQISYSRIISITQQGNLYNMLTEPQLNFLDECYVSIEIPRPVNVNTASVEVLKALFTGVRIMGGSEVTLDDSETLIRAILAARKTNPIEGYIEMARIIIDSFGEETDKTTALLKAISYPASNLFLLEQYTAPLCYNSDDIFEISAFAFIGGQNWRAKANEDLITVVSITPPGENTWSFRSQYDWQNLINCGFGSYSVSGPNACFVLPPDGNIFDIAPDKTEEDLGYVALSPYRVFRDDYTLFLAHFDTGTTETVFDAYSRDGEGEAVVGGLEVTEDPDDSAISEFGVRIASGCSLLYEAESNLWWQTNDANLKMALPMEFEMWVRLADDWMPTKDQILFDISDEKEFENQIRLWWKSPDSLVLTVCDAGLEQNRFHYKVPLPDPNNYISFTPGGSYHIRVVIYKSWQNYMTIMIDGKKLQGFYVADEGLALPGAQESPISDGMTSRLSNYEMTLPPQEWVGTTTDGRGYAQIVTVDGSLLSGNARTTTQTGSKDNPQGFIASVYVEPDEFGNRPDVAPGATKIPVVTPPGVEGFPDQGILCYKSGDVGEYIYYKGLNKDGPIHEFIDCERGYDFDFNGVAVGSIGQSIPDLTKLQLINLPVSGYEQYPPHGFLYVLSTDEVISYMGKAVVAGQECFIFNVMYGTPAGIGCGRGIWGTPTNDIPPNSRLIQIFTHNEPWFNFQKNDQLTIIDNDETKEYMTVIYTRGSWMAFDSPVGNPYYVQDPATLFQKYSRILKFPSSELPTIRHENFALGSDVSGNDPFNGWIDEFKVIAKYTGQTGTPEYQPYEIYYGRYSGQANSDLHFVIANPRRSVVEDETQPIETQPIMTGECFGLLDSYYTPYSPQLTELYNEAIFMVPTENNPETVPVTSVTLTLGSNNFLGNGLKVASTEGFPPEGYILVQGTYRIQYTVFGNQMQDSVGYHVVFHYDGVSGDSFSIESIFMTVDDSTSDSGSINCSDPDQSNLLVALISTEMKFEKRGALWTEKTEGVDPNGKGDFPEGARIMCLRYPFGTLLADSVDSDSETVSFKRMPLDTTAAHFELGTVAQNNLSVIGCDIASDAEDRLVWDLGFHGCFGTTPGSYSDGIVATMIPVRYLDRGKQESNSRYLRYLAAQTFKPGMRIRALEWQEELRHDEMGIRILMRVDNCTSWDTEPGDDNSTLREFLSPGDDKFEITSSNDSMSFDYFPGNFVEFRIFFEWTDGAYLSNAWKDSARLRNFRMYYERPNQVLSSRKSVY